MNATDKRGFVTQSVIVAYCTECAHGYEEDEGVLVFDSIDEAQDGIASGGWLIEGDKLICDRCIARAYCADHGHDWADWWTLPVKAQGEGRRWRVRRCEHCRTCETERLS